MKTILVIEDNNDIRENTCELLELEGYRVIFTEDGKMGIALAKENIPDVILCDIMLPGADGFEILNDLKKNPETSGIPFIFVSASVGKKAIETGLSMGARGYIQKPFEPQKLFEIIANCLIVI